MQLYTQGRKSADSRSYRMWEIVSGLRPGETELYIGMQNEYLNMNKFIEKIALAKIGGTFLKVISHLEKNDLIILDVSDCNLGCKLPAGIVAILEEAERNPSSPPNFR